jgi:hypothetical protein
MSRYEEQALEATVLAMTTSRREKLTRHLHENWRCQRFRAHERKTFESDREIVFGISGIYRWACNGGQIRTRNFAERVTSVVNATLMDASLNGFRFAVPCTLESFINAGDVFVVPSESRGDACALGITRWASEHQNGNIMLGAMRLDATVTPGLVLFDSIEHEVPLLIIQSEAVAGGARVALLAASISVPSEAVEIELPDAMCTYQTIRFGECLMATDIIKIYRLT